MPINSLNLSSPYFNKLGQYDPLPRDTIKSSINKILVTCLHPCCPIALFHIEEVDKAYYNCSHSIQLNIHTKKNCFTREPHPSEPNCHLVPCIHELKPTSCLYKCKTEFDKIEVRPLFVID